jgi:UDP-N-acetylmuramate-alanine ligase
MITVRKTKISNTKQNKKRQITSTEQSKQENKINWSIAGYHVSWNVLALRLTGNKTGAS